MIKILIFGTGKKYQQYKKRIKSDVKVVGLIDNDESKIHCYVDEIKVYHPSEICRLRFDGIVILSDYATDMIEQLIKLGIKREIIFDYHDAFEYINYLEDQVYGNLGDENFEMVIFSHSLRTTGAQNALFTLAKELKKKNEKVVIVSLENGEQLEWYRELDIPVIVSENITFFNNKLMQLLGRAKKILINTLWLYHIVLLCKKEPANVYWWIHETATRHDVPQSVFDEIGLYNNIIILSTSRQVTNNIRSLYGNDIQIKLMHYGLEEYTITECKKKNNKVIFACIGGISKIKGQDIFINAIDLLQKKYIEKAEFIIAGRGAFSADLQKKIQDNNIKFIGEVDNREINHLYSKIDVVVCSSRKDNMPIVVTEACMNHKISIVSDVVGIVECLHDKEDALIFEDENVEELSNLISWVIDNVEEAKKIGEKSRIIYDENFSMDRFRKEIENIGL